MNDFLEALLSLMLIKIDYLAETEVFASFFLHNEDIIKFKFLSISKLQSLTKYLNQNKEIQ